MDVVGGLHAARLAVDLAKDLQSIDRSLDDASVKLKLADLKSALADTKGALAVAKGKISDLEAEIASMSQGSPCPVCKDGRLKVDLVKHHDWNRSVEFHECSCDSDACDYTTQRQYNADIGEYGGGK